MWSWQAVFNQESKGTCIVLSSTSWTDLLPGQARQLYIFIHFNYVLDMMTTVLAWYWNFSSSNRIVFGRRNLRFRVQTLPLSSRTSYERRSPLAMTSLVVLHFLDRTSWIKTRVPIGNSVRDFAFSSKCVLSRHVVLVRTSRLRQTDSKWPTFEQYRHFSHLAGHFSGPWE